MEFKNLKMKDSILEQIEEFLSLTNDRNGKVKARKFLNDKL